jgi:NADPH-dependent 2,4-dienoyl-CoA reductase/sulfur reductase-like enzyme
MFGKRVACTINPSFELINEDTLEEAETKKDVLVIGGGVAGMEAAFVAKKRGHNVVLCEADEELGGLAKLAAVPIGKQDLTKVIQFMSRRLYDMGVDVRLNTTVTREMLENEFKGYEVLAATGAKANTIPAFTCFKQWMRADDILAGKAFPGQNIVIVGGGSVGCELADFLAPTLNDRFPRNRRITVLEMAPEIMMLEGGVVRSKLAMRMMEKGIQIETKAQVTSVTEDTITYVKEGIEYTIKDADTLVFANGYHIDSAMEDMLKEAGVNYQLLGDGAKVGNIKDAISGAYEIAKNL